MRLLNALALLAILAAPAFARTGPTAPPADPKDWPGEGAAGVFDLWTQRRQEFWENREKDRGAVAFLGSSTTQRWTTLAEDFPELKVANRGIGGDSARRCLFRFSEDVLDLDPRAVVIFIGSNDMNHNTTPTQAAANIRAMVDQAARHNPKMPVIVCHVSPRKEVPGKFPEKILALNRLIDAMAIGRPMVSVCPTWPGLANADGSWRQEMFADSVHPNENGYAVLAAALRKVFARRGLL